MLGRCATICRDNSVGTPERSITKPLRSVVIEAAMVIEMLKKKNRNLEREKESTAYVEMLAHLKVAIN